MALWPSRRQPLLCSPCCFGGVITAMRSLVKTSAGAREAAARGLAGSAWAGSAAPTLEEDAVVAVSGTPSAVAASRIPRALSSSMGAKPGANVDAALLQLRLPLAGAEILGDHSCEDAVEPADPPARRGSRVKRGDSPAKCSSQAKQSAIRRLEACVSPQFRETGVASPLCGVKALVSKIEKLQKASAKSEAALVVRRARTPKRMRLCSPQHVRRLASEYEDVTQKNQGATAAPRRTHVRLCTKTMATM